MGTHTKTPSPPPDDATVILDAIRRVVHVLRIGSRAAEKRVGLSGAQLFVLAALGQGPAASLNELAGRTRTHQSSVSVVVQRLVDAGLVNRARRVGADARQLELRLTPAGRARLRKAPDPAQSRLIVAIGRLPTSDQSRLAALMSRFVDALDSGSDDGAAAMFFEDVGRRPTSRGRAATPDKTKRTGATKCNGGKRKGSAHGAS